MVICADIRNSFKNTTNLTQRLYNLFPKQRVHDQQKINLIIIVASTT